VIAPRQFLCNKGKQQNETPRFTQQRRKIMTTFHHVASIIFLNPAGKFILQKRDEKPDIRHPGMLTAWGGAVEPGETPLQAALREIREETNLRPTESDLLFFGDYVRDYKVKNAQVICHVFLLKNIDQKSLKVYEGQGYEVIDPLTDKDNNLYTDLTKELIKDYTQKYK
jgi:ADP-ribose pyrophosphatase YjhB (NUDIX family)